MHKFLAIALAVAGISCGCASGPYMLPETEFAGDANPAAYGPASMTFRKAQPSHQDDKNWDFYFKHCAMNGDESYYSKTSYDCSGAFAR